MARKNIPLTIVKPGTLAEKIVFVANAKDQANTIPFRYPFADIENYAALKAAGFFRHSTTTVSTDLGGSAVADTASTLGFQLPRTEKLVLLCKVDTALTADKHIVVTVKGSTQYGIADKTFKLAEDNVNQDTDGILVAAGDVIEVDLYDFGLLLNSGEIVITAAGNATSNADDDHVSFALVARMG